MHYPLKSIGAFARCLLCACNFVVLLCSTSPVEACASMDRCTGATQCACVLACATSRHGCPSHRLQATPQEDP